MRNDQQGLKSAGYRPTFECSGDACGGAFTGGFHNTLLDNATKGSTASLAPVASSADEAGKAKNRRVELVLQ